MSADPDDNKFIDAAITGKAPYIVSGDTDLLSVAAYRGIRMLTPARFFALLQEKPAA